MLTQNLKSNKNILGIIQARTGSTRLPNKVFFDLAGKPLIWHVVERLKLSRYLSDIILATTTNEEDIRNRLLHFKLNVGENIAATETIFSFFLILGLPIYFLVISIIKKSYSSLLEKKLFKSFLITVIINSVIVILTTKARESRLFVIPLFFLWPIFFNYLKNMNENFNFK